MELQKIRSLTPEELAHQQGEAGEQMFRLRFQSRLGQTDSTPQIRSLRKDIARMHTVARQRELGLAVAPEKSTATKSKKSAKKSTKKAAVK
jgi:large subunit ribosomal protein L29